MFSKKSDQDFKVLSAFVLSFKLKGNIHLKSNIYKDQYSGPSFRS